MTEAVLSGLERAVRETGKETGKESRISFETRRVVFEGDLSVRIPGSGNYDGLRRVEIEHESPVKVDVSGLVAGNTGARVLNVKEGRAEVTGYRDDRTLSALDREVKLVKDPELTLYTNDGRKIVYNQVQGMPVVRINSGRVAY